MQKLSKNYYCAGSGAAGSGPANCGRSSGKCATLYSPPTAMCHQGASARPGACRTVKCTALCVLLHLCMFLLSRTDMVNTQAGVLSHLTENRSQPYESRVLPFIPQSVDRTTGWRR